MKATGPAAIDQIREGNQDMRSDLKLRSPLRIPGEALGIRIALGFAPHCEALHSHSI